MAENVVGEFGVIVRVIPAQRTEPSSRFRDLVVSHSIFDHVIDCRGTATHIDQRHNVWLIKDELAAHRDFFCCAHTCYFSFQVVKELKAKYDSELHIPMFRTF